MAQETHLFSLESVWTGDSDGEGVLKTGAGELPYGVPPQFGGPEGRVNPEELLLAAVASCYSITLALLAERKRLPLRRVELRLEGEVERQPGGTLRFAAIRIRPRVVLADADDAQLLAAEDSAHKAEQYCVISNAVRGKVQLTVEPEVVSEPV